MNLEYVLPEDIERRSFEIIESELHGREFPEKIKPVMYRVIHTTADFDYADNLCFSENAVDAALELLKNGAVIVTDTNMSKAGINKTALAKLGCEALCFMSDPETAEAAKLSGTTRAGCFGGPRSKSRKAGDIRLRKRPNRAHQAVRAHHGGGLFSGVRDRRAGGICERGAVQGAYNEHRSSAYRRPGKKGRKQCRCRDS